MSFNSYSCYTEGGAARSKRNATYNKMIDELLASNHWSPQSSSHNERFGDAVGPPPSVPVTYPYPDPYKSHSHHTSNFGYLYKITNSINPTNITKF